MSRYIEVDALKEYIGSVRAEFNFFDDDERARYEAHSKAIYLLDLYVSDASSIDIVRCAECKHWKESQYYPEFMVCTYVTGATFTRQHDDFCSRGERREP